MNDTIEETAVTQWVPGAKVADAVRRLRNRQPSVRAWLLTLAGSCLLSIAAQPGAAAPPTLQTIADQFVIQDQPTHAMVLGIDDPDTAVLDLQLSGTSSDPSLVPRENIFFGSAGQNRYLTVTPAFGQTGTATITITVSDGTDSASQSLVLTVRPPPRGTARFVNPSSIAIPDAGAAAPYPSPIEVAGMPGTVVNLVLTLSKFSHERVSDVDMLLVGPTGQGVVIFSGVSGGDRSATNVTVNLTDASAYPLPGDFALWSEPLRPAAYRPIDALPGAPPGPYGTVAMSAFNGLTANGTWSLYVYDEQPSHEGDIAGGWSLMIATSYGSTISTIPDQSITMNSATAALPFTVDGAQTSPDELTVTADSSDPALVPVGNILLGGSGTNRTVTVTPLAGKSGRSRIHLTMDNGITTVSTSFLLTVTEPLEGAVVFANSSVVTIPDLGAATPYPSTITVAGVTGVVSRVTVTLQTLRHTYPADLDILLVGPAGQKVILFSDAGGGFDVSPVTVTLSDAAASPLPLDGQIDSGFAKPTDYEPGETGDLDSFPEAPEGPYSPTLSAFNGLSPNGTWSLYVVDDGPGDMGSIDGGWSLAIRTTVPPTLSAIADQTTVVNTPTVAIPFTISGDETQPDALILSGSSSNPTLVPDDNIAFSGSGANRAVTLTPTANRIGTSTISLSVSDGASTASRSFVLEVIPALLIVSAVDAGRTYGATNPPLTGSVQGLQSGDVITANFSADATPVSAVGSYPITPTLADPDGKLPNYTVLTNPGALTVTPAPLSVTAADATRAYGAPNPIFTGTIEGLKNGDSITATFSSGATPASPAGSYPITSALADPGSKLGNYTVNTHDGTLTIAVPGPVTIGSIRQLPSQVVRIAGTGDGGVIYTVQASLDLVHWETTGTATADGSGAFEFEEAGAGSFEARFYRMTLP